MLSRRRTLLRPSAAGPATLVSDTFDRADSASSLGIADTGQAWSVIQGTWGITTNRAYRTSDANGDRAVLTSGAVNQDVSAVVNRAVGEGPGLIARASADTSAYYLLYMAGAEFSIYRRSAGVFTLLSSTADQLTSGVDTVARLVVDGSSLAAYVGGTLRLSVTDTVVTIGDYAGFYLAGGTTATRLDNFTVTAP